MPEWFICPPAKLAKPLCVEAMWQVPHSVGSGVGMWFDGCPVAWRPSWQVAQVVSHAAQDRMVELADRQERARQVALAARQRRRDVIGRLAGRPDAVVAARARAGRDGDVAEAGAGERGDGVAAVAALGGLDVLDRLGERAALVVLHVAAGAVLRRAFEDRLDVAGLAAHQFVRAGEREPRRHVIEAGGLSRAAPGHIAPEAKPTTPARSATSATMVRPRRRHRVACRDWRRDSRGSPREPGGTGRVTRPRPQPLAARLQADRPAEARLDVPERIGHVALLALACRSCRRGRRPWRDSRRIGWAPMTRPSIGRAWQPRRPRPCACRRGRTLVRLSWSKSQAFQLRALWHCSQAGPERLLVPCRPCAWQATHSLFAFLNSAPRGTSCTRPARACPAAGTAPSRDRTWAPAATPSRRGTAHRPCLPGLRACRPSGGRRSSRFGASL